MPDSTRKTPVRRAFAPFALIFTLALSLSACGGPAADERENEVRELLAAASSPEDIALADAYLSEHKNALSADQVGALLLLMEERSLAGDGETFDYADIEARYADKMPASLIDLFRLQQIEQETPIVEDAALCVSYAELLRRAESVENLIETHRGDALITEDALWLYRRYLLAVLTGATNSPLFDYRTYAFSDEARAVYEEYASYHPDSTLTWTLTEYAKYLNEIDYKLRYDRSEESTRFFDTCNRIIDEAKKRVGSET